MDNTTDTSGGASEAGRRIKDAAGAVAEQGKEALERTAQQGAERASSAASATADALRRAAGDVEPENRWAGAALRKSASALEQAGQLFDQADLSRSMHEINGFARRNPAIFLGASLALGFALARVGKTAIEEAQPHPPQGL